MIHNLAAGVSAFTSNVFLVEGDRRVLVDAGANFDVGSPLEDDPPEAVILTHTHPDHVGNVEALRDVFAVETWGFDPDHEAVDNPIAEDELVAMGDHEYRAIHTPGHKPDHLCFYAAEPGICFAGDLVFQNGGFGRTDLPGADRATLVESIDRLLSVVDEDLEELHVGHGPSITNEPYGHIELAGEMARRY